MGMGDMDPKVLVVASSFATWLIYKKFEPATPIATLLLLVALPGVIVAQARSHFSSLLWASFVAYTSFWSLLAAFIVGYRLSPFHPLAKFPGPTLYKISKFALASQYAKGTAREFFIQLHEQYGDAVRIGPNELSFRHGDTVAPILSSKPLPKGPYYDSRIQENATQLDGMRDFAEHARRRKLWNKSASVAAVKEYGEMLKEVVRDLLAAFESRQGEDLDISAWIGYTAFDFMGEMAYTKMFGLVKAGKDEHGLLHAVNEGTGEAAILSHVPWTLNFLALLPPVGALKFLRRYTSNVTQERIQSASTARDLFHHLSAQDEPEELRPSIASVTCDGMLAVIAGADTSATTLSHVFYFLLSSPECMRRLQQEIDETFPDPDETADYSKQADMPYLNACINEALRLYPPVQCGLQRRIESGTGGKMIGPYFVPEDTQVSAHLPLLQRDPRYFSPLPNDFWPDRFLSQPTYTLPSGETIMQDQLIHERSLFLPFSAGPQNCAGKAIAQQEMRAVLCAVLRKFDVEKADGFDLQEWENNVKDYYVTHRGSLMVKVKARRS